MALAQPNFVWCPYTLTDPQVKSNLVQGDYSTVEESGIPPMHRASGPTVAMLPSPRHGGLYSGPVSHNPWNSIPVTPTMTNMIQNNLRSANPPPGATEQYIGTERLGNNYAPMPGVYWFNPPESNGKYAIKVTHACEQRTYGEDGLTNSTKRPNQVDGLMNFYSNLL